jgi:hypothetical protein
MATLPTLSAMLPKTLLPLSRFAQIVGYSPMLFNQVYVPDCRTAAHVATLCSSTPGSQLAADALGGTRLHRRCSWRSR